MSLSILRASAGSGKTYALTQNYLQLLLAQDNPGYFRSILAVTFTNKATQEMKLRILTELEKIARGETDKGMGKSLVEQLSILPDDLQSRANKALTNMLHNYSHFSVSTIDSFFQKVVRSFAKEAELPATYKIELNTSKVLKELTNHLLVKAEHDAQLSDWLIQFSSDKLRQGKSWDIRRNLNKLIQEVVKEDFTAQVEGFDKLNSSKKNAENYLAVLWKAKQECELSMKQLGIKALEAIESNNLTIGDFLGGSKGAANYLNNVAIGKYIPSTTIWERLNDKQWSKKKPDKNTIIIDKLAIDCLNEYLKEIIDNYIKYNSANIVLEQFVACALFGQYMQLLKQYRTDNNVLLISDVADLLNNIIDGNDLPFIYEKTGSRYNHFLIDEFQDTSTLHWNNFRPLLENSIASGYPNLIVGDPKQSIYRWRGGDLRLMLQDVKQQIPGAKNNYLQDNWRSCEEVIKFNNCLFKHAVEIVTMDASSKKNEGGTKLSKEEENIIQGLVTDIKGVYENSEQLFPSEKTSQNNRTGFVQVQLVQSQNNSKLEEENDDELDPSFKNRANTLLVKNIDNVCSKGYLKQDIALLVRTNHEARELATYLTEACYDVLSEDALRINSANTVQLLISLMHYLHNTNNKPAIAAAAKLYATIKGDNTFNLSDLQKCSLKEMSSFADLLPEEFILTQASLNRLTLYDLCRRLSRIFELENLTDEEHYLEAFMNEVHRYSHEEKGEIGGFLEWWEDEGIQLSLKRDQAPDAIRILTVHKSKGLQYPVVIIPYCNWNLNAKPSTIWADCNKKGATDRNNLFLDLPLSAVPITYKAALSSTYFRFEQLQEMFQAYLDNLNMLYVALTRAEEALFITAQENVPKNGRETTSRHAGWVVKKCIEQMGSTIEETSESIKGDDFSYKQAIFGELENRTSNGPELSCSSREYTAPLKSWERVLSIHSKAKPIQADVNSHIATSINYGILVHDVLARVTDLESLPRILECMQLQSEITRKDAALLQSSLNKLLKNKQIASWFSKEWLILNEQPILGVGGGIHRPDRVLIKDKLAKVIDYKTGKRDHHHQLQISSYMEYLDQMGYEVEGYLLYLNDENPIEQVAFSK